MSFFFEGKLKELGIMGYLKRIGIDTIKELINSSNIDAAGNNQKYIFWENIAILNDYECIACDCPKECWCRQHKCQGHYIIKDISFDCFLDTYVKLWTPVHARNGIKEDVIWKRHFVGRQEKSVQFLKDLKINYDNILDHVRQIRKCGFCDNVFDEIQTVLSGSSLSLSISNLYQAKLLSQLFYDSIVAFDTASRRKIVKAGYSDPLKHPSGFISMNQSLYEDLKAYDLPISEYRELDKPFSAMSGLSNIPNGQPMSRVVDKIFYSPKTK
jgi:hypothetical protein